MVSFEIFVKAMPPSLSELKVLPSFCFPIKIRDDRAVTSIYHVKFAHKECLARALILPWKIFLQASPAISSLVL